MSTWLVLVEGLPGSGKTSLSEWLCGRIRAQGRPASWVSELQTDHPVIDRSVMRTARERGYAERCAARWEAFSRKVERSDSSEVIVLEACLFQSTVRFLVEYKRPAHEAEGYMAALEQCLAPLDPLVVYLTQTDPETYLRQEVGHRKGDEIVSKIAAYSATTPYAVGRGLDESQALVSLYVSYRRLCDALVARLSFAVLQVDTVRFDEAAVRDRVGSWVDAALKVGAIR